MGQDSSTQNCNPRVIGRGLGCQCEASEDQTVKFPPPGAYDEQVIVDSKKPPVAPVAKPTPVLPPPPQPPPPMPVPAASPVPVLTETSPAPEANDTPVLEAAAATAVAAAAAVAAADALAAEEQAAQLQKEEEDARLIEAQIAQQREEALLSDAQFDKEHQEACSRGLREDAAAQENETGLQQAAELQVEVIFKTSKGELQTLILKRRPLGVEFARPFFGSLKVGISGFKNKSYAQELGAEKGWLLVSVDSTSVSGLSFDKAVSVLNMAVAPLPMASAVDTLLRPDGGGAV